MKYYSAVTMQLESGSTGAFARADGSLRRSSQISDQSPDTEVFGRVDVAGERMQRSARFSAPLSCLGLALAIIFTLALPAFGADWPQFRGPNSNGVADEAGLPTKLDANALVWNVSLPGRGLSSPIIMRDRVFVTASSGPKQDRLHVICFNASNGSIRWHRQFWAT